MLSGARGTHAWSAFSFAGTRQNQRAAPLAAPRASATAGRRSHGSWEFRPEIMKELF